MHVEKTQTGTVKATVSRGTGKVLDDVRITPSANGGYSLQASYRETEKSRRGGVMASPSGWRPPETFVFTDFESLVAGLRKCLRGKA